jgi:hypothetical protein
LERRWSGDRFFAGYAAAGGYCIGVSSTALAAIYRVGDRLRKAIAHLTIVSTIAHHLFVAQSCCFESLIRLGWIQKGIHKSLAVVKVKFHSLVLFNDFFSSFSPRKYDLSHLSIIYRRVPYVTLKVRCDRTYAQLHVSAIASGG